MKQQKIKILVCCHKRDIMAKEEPYMPIHVGKALHPDLDLGIQGDNTGDNISNKNGNYCELTGMYWAWKNLKDVNIIGLCHYRRYFDLSSLKNFDREPYIRKNVPLLQESKITGILNKYDIILPGKSYSCNSVWESYAIGHSRADIVEVENAIRKFYPEYLTAFDITMRNRNYYCGCNMLICKKTLFDDYCKWLFVILEEVEKNVDIKKYDSYQRRIFGFMSERLLNVYVFHNHLKVCHRPVVSIMAKKNPSRLKQIIHRMKSNFCFYLK